MAFRTIGRRGYHSIFLQDRVLNFVSSMFSSGENGCFYHWNVSDKYNNSNQTGAVTSDGAVVGWLQDLSGNDNHAIQVGADGTKPTYNSQNGLNFNGSSNYLTADSIASLLGGNDPTYSVGVVIRINTVVNGATWLFGGSTSSAIPHQQFSITDSTPDTFVAFRQDDTSTNVIAANNIMAYDTVSYRHYIFNQKGTTIDGWNNTILGLNNLNFNVGTLTNNALTIGARRRTTITDYIAADIKCLFIINRNITANEISYFQTINS